MKSSFRLCLAALLLSFIAATSVSAEHPEDSVSDSPLALAAEHPLLLRRTTLIVRDMEASLALYRDALGMEIIYDEEIHRPHASEDREQRLRLIFLKASHEHVGVVGLVDYEYGYPDHPAHSKPVRREGFVPGNAILLFNTTELEERWPSISGAPGVEVISKPKLTRYPGYNGAGDIQVLVSKFYDADGYLIELNQILSF
ncbi:MAG: VOC family protein [Lysobacterales bacterium]|jgi:catechol 2,3-dioxygenase-like lactoylglutathione lyase family enzyme